MSSDLKTTTSMVQPTSPDKVSPHAIQINLSHSDLTAEQQIQLGDLLNNNRDIFAFSPDDLGRMSVIKHKADTEHH